MCAEKVLQAQHVLVVSQLNDGKAPRRSAFSEALTTLKSEAGPATTRVTEALLNKLGGAEAVGGMIADDIRRVRGDDLPPEMKQLHDVDTKSLTRLYDLVLRSIAKRDDLVQGVSDPLDGMDPDDLMPLVAEAAFMMIEADPEFRIKILRKIQEVAEEEIEQVLMEGIGLVPRPGVEVA